VSLTSLQNAVTAAAAKGGGWVPSAFNQVCDSSDTGYSTCMSSAKPVDSQVLSAFLDWVQSPSAPAGTTVRTVRAVMGSPDQPPLPARPTSVSLTFDDGDVTQLGIGDVLAAHHVRGTFYINSGSVDAHEQGSMTWHQIASLAAAGNDIGGHTRDHVNLTSTSTTYDAKWHEVCDDRARLQAQGYDAVSFAYPEGAFNSAAEGIVKGCGYQSARTAGALSATGPRYAESFTPSDPFAYQAVGTTYNGPITLQVLEDTVSAAMGRGGGWIPFVFHHVCYAGTDSYDACMAAYRPVDSAVIDAFLTWVGDLAGQNLTVRTVADVLGAGRVAPSVRVTSPTDGATTTATPDAVGSGVPGSTVQVSWYAGRYSVGTPAAQGTAVVASDGSWTATSPVLPTGSVTVQAAETVNGVTGTSVPVTFSVRSP
jgi:peptidoglycan/xylan/chitin deacetylase (PgdA/CDA1 family)